MNDFDIPFVPQNLIDSFNQAADCAERKREKKQKDVIEFYVVDSNGDIAADGFECVSDAIYQAHVLAEGGSEYFVERIARRKMGSAKPVVTTEWIAA